MPYPVEIRFEKELDDQFMEMLFAVCNTAVSNWFSCAQIDYHDTESLIPICYHVVEREGRRVGKRSMKPMSYRVEGETFRLGFQRILSGACDVDGYLLAEIAVAFLDGMDAELSKEAVDALVQAGLYNEIVWR